MLAPVQVVVVAVLDEERGLDVLAALGALDSSAVRLLDSFLVGIDTDGTARLRTGDVGVLPPSAGLFLAPEGAASSAGWRNDAASDARDVWDLGQVVPAGSHAVVVVLEHLWATHLRDTLAAAGGGVTHESWLDADDRATLEELLHRTRQP